MQHRIEQIAKKKFIGKNIEMSFADNKTSELWGGFAPMKNEITNAIGSELYSMEVYPENFFSAFNPANRFTKWAAVEVTDFDNIPGGMETLTAPAGQYAVFIHKGPASEGAKTYQYIFTEWLPKSGYTLANRPHFAVMGDKYQHDSPDSEEEIWIPVD